MPIIQQTVTGNRVILNHITWERFNQPPDLVLEIDMSNSSLNSLPPLPPFERGVWGV